MYFHKINFHGCHWLRKYFYNGNFQIYGIILFHLSIIMICTVDEGEGWWCEWPHSPTLPPKDHPGQNQLCKYPLLLPRWVNSCMYTTVCMFRLVLPQAFPSFQCFVKNKATTVLGSLCWFSLWEACMFVYVCAETVVVSGNGNSTLTSLWGYYITSVHTNSFILYVTVEDFMELMVN